MKGNLLMRLHLTGRRGVIQVLPLDQRHPGHHLVEIHVGHVAARRAQPVRDVPANRFEIFGCMVHFSSLVDQFGADGEGAQVDTLVRPNGANIHLCSSVTQAETH